MGLIMKVHRYYKKPIYRAYIHSFPNVQGADCIKLLGKTLRIDRQFCLGVQWDAFMFGNKGGSGVPDLQNKRQPKQFIIALDWNIMQGHNFV